MNVCTGALPAIGIGHDRLDRGEKSLRKISSLSGGGISCGRAIPCWTDDKGDQHRKDWEQSSALKVFYFFESEMKDP
jgi:hypothetical protein